jgi:ATP-dependent Clp protease protease subunit
MAEDDGPTTILLFGEINDELVAQACHVIIAEQYRENPKDKITIMINSPGGELHAGFALIEIMEASRIPIETIAIGQCVSAALMIFMSGTPGMRTVTRTCTAMSHTYSTGIEGNHWDLKDIQKELSNTQDRIIAQYEKCTGQSKAIIMKKLIGKGDHWLRPEEMVKYGIADHVGPVQF